MRGTRTALRNRVAAVSLVACASLAAAAARAEGVAASETIFPATTRAWLSVPDVRGLRQRFDRSPYGQLLADPTMAAFVEHVRGEINKNSKQRLAKLGLTLEDLERIPGGEVAVAAIEPQPGQMATVLVVDVTGHETEARELVETITARLLGARRRSSRSPAHRQASRCTVCLRSRTTSDAARRCGSGGWPLHTVGLRSSSGTTRSRSVRRFPSSRPAARTAWQPRRRSPG